MNRRGFFGFMGGAAAAAVVPIPTEFIIDGPIVAGPINDTLIIDGGMIATGTITADRIIINGAEHLEDWRGYNYTQISGGGINKDVLVL